MPATVDKLLGKALLHTHKSGDVHETTSTVTAGTTTAGTDTVILANAVSGNVIINLPQASTTADKTYIIKKIDASVYTVTVHPYAADMIDSSTADVVIAYPNTAMQIVSNGTSWYIK